MPKWKGRILSLDVLRVECPVSGMPIEQSRLIASITMTMTLKSAVERGSFDQTMDEMDIVDPVDFTRKGIDFLVHFVHKVHDIQRIARRIRS